MTQVTDGLVNDGKTAHFAISYESSMDPGDGRSVAQGLMNVVEGDLAVVTGWFAGTGFAFSYPISIELHNGPPATNQAEGGAGWVCPPTIASWVNFSPTVTVKAVGFGAPEQGLDFVRYLLVSEVTEMFMASKDNGWHEHRTLLTEGDEGSKGEGLSRFLAHEFCLVQGITARFAGFEVVPLWLNPPGNRPNEVEGSPDDHKGDVVTGGTTCFIYYLHDQLGFAIPDIINAGSTTLADVYQKLTGRTDAWLSFSNLVNLHYPLGPSAVHTAGDNIFPVPNLRSVDNGVRITGGEPAQLYIALDAVTPVDVTLQLTSDDPATLQVPATVLIPNGKQDLLVPIQSQGLAGPERTVTVHVTYAGVTLAAPVTVLPDPSGLTGVITIAGGREPIAGAIVVIDGPASAGVNAAHFQLQTGPDGSYTADPTGGLAPGSYRIEVTASGYAPVTENVTVTEGIASTQVDIALPVSRPLTVSGTVTDGAAQPLPGVSVSLAGGFASNIGQGATTGSRGAYSLTLDPGIYGGAYTLSATLAGYTSGEVNLASIANGATVTEDFVLLALGTLTGLITNAGATPATPVAGAEVIVGSAVVSSDATGRYTVPQLTPGPAAVSVRAPGFDPADARVSVPSGGTLTQDFDLTPASAVVTGTVTDESDGSPLAGVHVRVNTVTTYCNTAGVYRVMNVPAGQASVVVAKSAGFEECSITVQVAPGETVTQDISLIGVHDGTGPWQ